MCANCTPDQNETRVEILEHHYGPELITGEYGHIAEEGGVSFETTFFNIQKGVGGGIRIFQKRTDTVMSLVGFKEVESLDLMMFSQGETVDLITSLLEMLDAEAVAMLMIKLMAMGDN